VPSASADGLRIEYADEGGGDGLPLVCLTGWCSSRERYRRLVPHLAGWARVVTLDWRGHGGSERPDGDWGTDAQVRDVLAVVDAAGLESFAVVTASHSGWVAIELRRQLGDRVARIVHMDWLVVEPSEPYMALIRKLQSEESWVEARDALFEIWRGDVASADIERAIAVMNRHEAAMWIRSGREIEAAFARSGSALQGLSALDLPPPVLHLYGQPRDPDYLERQQAFAAEHEWFDVRQVAARSHFSMIETPAETASMIKTFLAPDPEWRT
jgi:pimeloyl-ACP methyl ester carboxylesterase